MAENTLHRNSSQSGGASPCGQAEQALDGVRYARILHGNVLWRLGAVNTAWREALAPLGAMPGADALSGLEGKGIWLSPDASAEPLAVMCGGMGALWPGVGRGLYDAFPAARAAMDLVQSVADWDVLSLMDEKDLERINATRWQIPYLFLLEYAQWSCLAELGLSPGLLFGHSLGELMALCFAGIYGPDVGWYILDTHAVHVAELEARASRRTAMMSVHAELSVIEEVRAAWPEIVVVNYNTRTQFILSGPRDALGEARARLRKRRIPAIMLPVSLMFHSPGMRVLRDVSLKNLKALELNAPRVPVLSMASTGFYPDDAAGISRLIADLDETPVRWLENVENAWAKHGVRHFLELGPRDVLCGLVRDIEPGALCLACDRKDREIDGMREACARLYALGHLSWDGIARRARSAPQGKAAESSVAGAQAAVSAAPPPANNLPADDDPAMRTVADLLSRASNRPAGEIGPNTDLRYDLALRSSSFPLLVSEAEKAFGVSVPFETLLGVVTAGDLARVLSGRDKNALEKTAAGDGPEDEAALRFAPPLLRFAVVAGGPVPLPFDPAGKGILPDSGATLAVCCADAAFVRDFLGGLAPLGLHLSVPEPLAPWKPSADTTRRAAIAGAPVAEDAVIAACARGADCLLFAAAKDCADPARAAQLLRLCVGEAGAGLRSVVVVRRFSADAAENGAASVFGEDALVRELERVASERGLACRCIDVCDGAGLRPLCEYADMLARELLRGGGAGGWRHVLWAPAETAVVRGDCECHSAVPCVVTRDELFPLVFPDPQGTEADGCRRFMGTCHFSRFADPALALHGAQSVADLPYASAFRALAEGALTLVPWLTVRGMIDVRFHPMPLIPIGAVRECRVDTLARPWLLHEGVMKRLFRARLTARTLSDGGRRLDAFDPVMEATVLATARASSPSPLWDAGAWPGSAASHRRNVLDVDARYAALGLGDPWRLLAALSVLPGNTSGEEGARDAFAGTLSRQAYLLARDCGKCYDYKLRMLEAVIQAASFAVAADAERCGEGPGGGQFPAAGWRLNAAGVILFGPAPSLCGGELLEMRRSWKDEALQRFDAQVLDVRGRVLLTVNFLEFIRPAADSAHAETEAHE